MTVPLLVSVYIPTKNRLDMLQAAIESVLNQTHRGVEVIVVDDASTDGTKSYLTELAAKDTRVKFLSNSQSKGACVARNMAIKQAQGEFVTGLDDDDEFEPYHLAALLEYWQLLKQSGVEFSALFVNYKYRNDGQFSYSKKVSSVDFNDMHTANHVGNQLFSTRENYLKAGLFDETMPAWQDLEFFYRFLKVNGTARLLDVNSYVFDITPRGDRISRLNKSRILNSFVKFVTKHDLLKSHLICCELAGQVYSDYYGFKFEPADVGYFLKAGFMPKTVFKIFRDCRNKKAVKYY